MLKQYLKPYRKQLVVGPFFKLVEALLEILIPTLMVYVIDVGIKGGNRSTLWHMMPIMLGISLLGLGSAVICQHSASIASQGFGTRLRNAVFEKISRMPSRELNRFGASTLVNRITNDVNVLQQSVAMLIRLAIRVPFIAIGSLVMAALLDWQLALVILVSLPFLIVVIYLVMSRSSRLYASAQKELDRIALVTKENLSGVRVIRAFEGGDREQKRFEGVNEDYLRVSKRVSVISSLLNPLTALIMNLAILAILYFGGFGVDSGRMTQGELIAFTNYIAYILNALLVTAGLIVLFTKAKVSVARVTEILQTDTSLTFTQPSLEGREDCAVEFREVSFQYDEGEGDKTLDGLSFSLEKGKTLGIIGVTGSGKTTLVNLICRFYDATQGKILLFGRDVRSYPLMQLRRMVSIALQRSVLFRGTIADNIRQGHKEATLQEVAQAAEVAQAMEFIEKKEGGLDAWVERSGRNLSGGQKQRISIARAILPRPQILILDDSTSALDYATDARLRTALREYARDMTVLIVSQRIAAIRAADSILVLEDGKLAGLGSHDTLLEECATYREFVLSQQDKEEGGEDK